MADEIFDVVDERDQVTGRERRPEVHRLGLRHRAVHVLVFNRSGHVFLQKRSRLKDTFPGAWDSSASGHVDQGEAYDACAVRELREEIGLRTIFAPKRLFKIEACPQTGMEFVWVYRCEAEGPFVLKPDELEAGGWFVPDVVTRWLRTSPDEFADGMIVIWDRLEREHPLV